MAASDVHVLHGVDFGKFDTAKRIVVIVMPKLIFVFLRLALGPKALGLDDLQ